MEASKKKVEEHKSVHNGTKCNAEDGQKQLLRFRQLLQQNSLQLKDAALQLQTVIVNLHQIFPLLINFH